MATKEVTSLPKRYEYYDSNISDPAGVLSHDTVTRCLDNAGTIIYDGFAFGGIGPNSKILGFKVKCDCRAYYSPSRTYPSRLSFRLVTGFQQGHSSSGYTSISDDAHVLYEKTSSQSSFTACEYMNMDAASNEVAWMQQNIGKLLGGTEFGIRIFGRRNLFMNLTITIYYDEISKAYAGGGTYIGGLRRRYAG